MKLHEAHKTLNLVIKLTDVFVKDDFPHGIINQEKKEAERI